MCSGLGRLEKFEVLKLLLTAGKPAGRRAAAAALADFQGADANRLVLAALRNDDARVQASALGQLRDRGLPGAMATLIEALDSPDEIVRETARRCLREFSFSHFLGAFDGLDEQVRRNTGRLVKKVDLTTPQRLAEEMNAAARSRRLRAIEMTAVLGMADELEAELIQLLDDDDHLVRMEAAMALAGCSSDKSRLALRDALLDRSVSVQNAAERALDAMATIQPPRSGKIDVAALSLPDGGLLSAGRHTLASLAAPLLAQSASWQDMGRRFREGGSTLDSTELLVLVAFLVGLFALLWLISRFLLRDQRQPYHNSAGLFRQLCRAHRLSWRRRSLLWKLARAHELAEPAAIFLAAERFTTAHLPPKLGKRGAEIASLHAKLFGSHL